MFTITGFGVKWVTSEGKMGHFTFINKIPDGEDGSPEITKIKIGFLEGAGQNGTPLYRRGIWLILIFLIKY